MLKRTLTIAALGCITVAGCSNDSRRSALEPQFAQAQPSIQIIRYDDTGRFPGQINCTGEAVDWELHLMVVSRTTIDANGGFHGTFTVHDQGSSGVGLESGKMYRMVTAQSESFNASADQLPSTNTAIFSRRFISQGSLENFQVHNVFHITVGPDGTVTSFKNTVSRVCD